MKDEEGSIITLPCPPRMQKFKSAKKDQNLYFFTFKINTRTVVSVSQSVSVLRSVTVHIKSIQNLNARFHFTYFIENHTLKGSLKAAGSEQQLLKYKYNII